MPICCQKNSHPFSCKGSVSCSPCCSMPPSSLCRKLPVCFDPVRVGGPRKCCVPAVCYNPQSPCAPNPCCRAPPCHIPTPCYPPATFRASLCCSSNPYCPTEPNCCEPITVCPPLVSPRSCCRKPKRRKLFKRWPLAHYMKSCIDKRLYRNGEHLCISYAGHIPGEMYIFGRTLPTATTFAKRRLCRYTPYEFVDPDGCCSFP